MPTACTSCPLRKMDAFQPFSDDELDFMLRFKVGELVVDPGTPILMEGSNAPQLYTVLEGLGLRYKLLPSGERQVLNLIFPGAFLGLQAGVMQQMGHSVEATTKMKLCVFDRKTLWTLFKNHPERAFDLTWLAAMQEHFLGESLLTVGQRDALASVAWMFVLVAQRGESLGLLAGGKMDFPYAQQDLADALGYSLVHLNRTLRRLRELQLVTWADGVVHFHDMAELARLADVPLEPMAPRPLI
ncbi:cyclic nucleotide-binding domain-containing protein [Rhodobacterales bacterium HKCCE3408]|nr:cyclic nucleotide-binding domain-containing protein [Rhodobacterales bacterium HKCCE3408]